MKIRRKRVAICFVLLIIGCCETLWATPSRSEPNTKVEQAPLYFLNAADLPQMQQLQTLPFLLSIHNGGSMPIHLQRLTTICHCIRVVKYPTELAAGATGTIALACTGHREVGIFNNQLLVRFTQGKLHDVMHASTRLVMRTIKLKDILVYPLRYNFGWKLPCEIERIPVVFRNRGSQTYRVKSLSCNQAFSTNFRWPHNSILLRPGTRLRVLLLPRIFARPGKYSFEIKLSLINTAHPSIQQQLTSHIVGRIAEPPVLRTRNLEGVCSLQGGQPEIVLGMPSNNILRVTAPPPFALSQILPHGAQTVVKFKLSQPVGNNLHVAGSICVYTSDDQLPIFAVPVRTKIQSTVSGFMQKGKIGDEINLSGVTDAEPGIQLRTVLGTPIHFTSRQSNGDTLLSTKRGFRLLVATVPVPMGSQKLLLLAPPSQLGR